MLRTKNYLSGEKKFRPKKKLAAKWAGPFELIEKISDTAFRVRLPPKWRIHDVFHIANFWPAVVSKDFDMREEIQPPPDVIEGMDEYEVESILKRRTNKKTKEIEYLVMWKGYPDDVSWEREENLKNCEEMVNNFNKENGYEVMKLNARPVREVDVRKDKVVTTSRGRIVKKKNLD